ncbi:MAG TPA: hypothetical protein VMS22_08205 [Candidatus Eisenbacteria bacterium]|nr:hypothetical protein [Candidatus Eisenbacteria bacterium]
MVRSLYLALAIGLAIAGSAARAQGVDPCDLPDGTMCADDGDPCTTDLCMAGACVHHSVPSRITCEPVLDAYRRAVELGAMVAELQELVATSQLPEGPRVTIMSTLEIVGGDLATTSDALAGRIPLPLPANGSTVAQIRARAGLELVAGTSPLVRPLARALAKPVPDLARRARFLYRSTNQLKRELRRIQRVSGVFVR